jgi:hypothetical protein
MRHKLFILFIFIISISSFAQSINEIGVWFQFKDPSINTDLFDKYYFNNLDSSSLPFHSDHQSMSSGSFYWDGEQWNSYNIDISDTNPIFILMPINNSSFRIGTSIKSNTASYDIFTDKGWIHVNNNILYNYKEDVLHYDEENNRLIMFKQNIPWMFYLNNENSD